MGEDPSEIIGQDTSLKEVFRVLRRVARTDSTVLVTGESGTGKELAVRALHQWSKRSSGRLVPVNCGAIPRDLLESELFGHVKGAYTGAVNPSKGRFKEADHGTIFLDEIGELELPLQAKILRALQQKEIEPVGGGLPQSVDVRIVAATNRDLEKEMEQGRFREDLYYRLNVIPVHLPPLRERGEDILRLARFFMQRYCTESERPVMTLSDGACRLLMRYSWPGNVRELENYMERMAILAEGDELMPEDLPLKLRRAVETGPEPAAPTPAAPGAFVWPDLSLLDSMGLSLKEFMEQVEDRLIREALEASAGTYQQAAKRLGVKRTTLIEKMRRKERRAPESGSQEG